MFYEVSSQQIPIPMFVYCLQGKRSEVGIFVYSRPGKSVTSMKRANLRWLRENWEGRLETSKKYENSLRNNSNNGFGGRSKLNDGEYADS